MPRVRGREYPWTERECLEMNPQKHSWDYYPMTALDVCVWCGMPRNKLLQEVLRVVQHSEEETA